MYSSGNTGNGKADPLLQSSGGNSYGGVSSQYDNNTGQFTTYNNVSAPAVSERSTTTSSYGVSNTKAFVMPTAPPVDQCGIENLPTEAAFASKIETHHGTAPEVDGAHHTPCTLENNIPIGTNVGYFSPSEMQKLDHMHPPTDARIPRLGNVPQDNDDVVYAEPLNPTSSRFASEEEGLDVPDQNGVKNIPCTAAGVPLRTIFSQ
eukprot:g2443.t1